MAKKKKDEKAADISELAKVEESPAEGTADVLPEGTCRACKRPSTTLMVVCTACGHTEAP